MVGTDMICGGTQQVATERNSLWEQEEKGMFQLSTSRCKEWKAGLASMLICVPVWGMNRPFPK
jgi:hypothetical protein